MKAIFAFVLVFGLAAAWPHFHCPVDFAYTDATVSLHFSSCGLPSNLNVAPSAFDVISFNGFNAVTGDVEGRLLTNNFNVGAGFTVGWGADNNLLWNLVVNNNATFISGDVVPSTSDFYVGQYFSGATYLANRVVPCNGQRVNNGVQALINAAKNNYLTLTNDLKGQGNSASWTMQYNTFHLTSFYGKAAQLTYFLTIQASDFNKINAYSFDALAGTWVSGAILTINVVGPQQAVTFNGGQFPSGFVHHVIYNFPNATSITVNTGVYGDILAPFATLTQTGGVIIGKVVVKDIALALQINRPNCS